MASVFGLIGVLVVLYFIGLGVYAHFEKKEDAQVGDDDV